MIDHSGEVEGGSREKEVNIANGAKLRKRGHGLHPGHMVYP